jgi:parallel beta-helix repeat protein
VKRALVLALLVGVGCTGCATGTTGDPWGVSGTRAAVFGSVATNSGGEVEFWIEYGTSTAYGSETAHQTATLAKNSSQAQILNIDGLQRSTTYHYRVCARDSQQDGGPGCGEDRQLTTTNVDCGDTITADLRLSGDLNCIRTGGRDGPVVGANGIDIDLNGHQVSGAQFALSNRGGFDDVTIRSGTLYAFDTALVLENASRNRVVAVGAGLLQNPFTGPSTSAGIRITGGDANEVRRTVLQASSIGVSATGSPGLLVVDSSGGVGAGSRGGGTAVAINGDLARVLRNQFAANISVSGSNNRIVGNDVEGVYFGIQVTAGHDNLVAGNQVHETVTLPFAPDGGDGILVADTAIGSRLRDNVVTSSFDDGIDVRNATTKLRDNRADDNEDFGIDAVPGVIDLGGNAASGNGNPLQCRNVFCGG